MARQEELERQLAAVGTKNELEQRAAEDAKAQEELEKLRAEAAAAAAAADAQLAGKDKEIETLEASLKEYKALIDTKQASQKRLEVLEATKKVCPPPAVTTSPFPSFLSGAFLAHDALPSMLWCPLVGAGPEQRGATCRGAAGQRAAAGPSGAAAGTGTDVPI